MMVYVRSLPFGVTSTHVNSCEKHLSQRGRGGRWIFPQWVHLPAMSLPSDKNL